MTVAYPKRTQKKNLNRKQLIEAAVGLFSTKGYQHTKLEDVAIKAELHVQTLYRHFRSKDELATAAADFVVNYCRSLFEDAPKDHSTFQVWREFITTSVSQLSAIGFLSHKKEQLRSPSSMMNDNFLLIVYAGYEDLLTEYLAKDFQMNQKHQRLPRLAACLLWSGNEAAIKRCAGLDIGEDRLDDVDTVLTESLGVVDDVEALFTNYLKGVRNS